MRQIKIIRRVVFVAAALFASSMVGSSWAYWTQELRVANEYELAKYDTAIVERFVSPDGWLPGSSIEKIVSVQNSGTLPVFIKLTLNQKWIRTENVYDIDKKIVPPAKGGAFPLTFDAANGKEYAARIKWGDSVVLLSSGKTSVASLSLGLPTVNSVKDAQGKWLLISETPDANGNYTLYYGGTLSAGAVSLSAVQSVRMNENIRPSVLEDNTVWDKQKQEWVTTTLNNPTASYENAKYTLSVTMNTVQGTRNALLETFKSGQTGEQTVIDELSSFASNPGDINSSTAARRYTLYFEETNGRMVFTPGGGSAKNWFMVDSNMVPGGEYTHTLSVENRSQKTYDLYMQVMEVPQNDKQKALMEYIYMRVYNGTELLYDGRVSGKVAAGSTGNLQNVVPLGTYQPSGTKEIRVGLLLDKNTPIEYAGMIANIDWNFMVEEQVGPTPTPTLTPTPTPTPTPEPVPYGGTTVVLTPRPAGSTEPVPYGGPASPKTGDDGVDASTYIVVMALSGLCLAGCVVFLIATRKRRYTQANA